MAESSREALPEVRAWSGGAPVGSVSLPRSGQEALLEGREWWGVHTGEQEVVGRSSQRAGSGQMVVLQGREWSGRPPKMVGRLSQKVGRPSRRVGRSSRRVWSPPEMPGVVGRPSV